MALENIGKNLAKARILAGVGSPEQLSKMAGASTNYARQVEAGEIWPSREMLEKLADCVHVRPEWLVTGEGPMEPGGLECMSMGEISSYLDRLPDDVRDLVGRLLREMVSMSAARRHQKKPR